MLYAQFLFKIDILTFQANFIIFYYILFAEPCDKTKFHQRNLHGKTFKEFNFDLNKYVLINSAIAFWVRRSNFSSFLATSRLRSQSGFRGANVVKSCRENKTIQKILLKFKINILPIQVIGSNNISFLNTIKTYKILVVQYEIYNSCKGFIKTSVYKTL